MNIDVLKNSILQMAIQGKLAPQDSNDEPASALLEKIRAERERLIEEGKIKRPKNESIIFRGCDKIAGTRKGRFYEQTGDGSPVDITDELPFEIPENWEWARLETILTKLTDGSHVTPTYVTNGIPFLSVKDVSSGKIDLSNCKYISKKDHDNLYKRCDPEYGNILLTKVGTTGIPVVIDIQEQFSIFVSVALLKFSHIYINKYFLKDLINSPLVQDQAARNTKGVGNKNWVIRDIANTLLPLPPLAEQKRIADKLDEIFSHIASYKKTAAELLHLNAIAKKSILQHAIQGKLVPQDPNDEPASGLLEKIRAERERLIEEGKIKRPKTESRIFRRGGSWWEKNGEEENCIDEEIPFEIPESWEWARLESLGQIIGGGTPDTKNKEYWENGDIAWITPADMKNVKNRYIDRGMRQITKLGLTNSSATLVPKNSLIYSTRAPIGHIAFAANSLATNQGFKTLVPYNFEIVHFMYYTIVYFTPEIQKRASGTTFKEISGFKYGQTLVPLPPLAEQKRIAEKLSQFMNMNEDLKAIL